MGFGSLLSRATGGLPGLAAVPGGQLIVGAGVIAGELDKGAQDELVQSPFQSNPHAEGGPLWGVRRFSQDREYRWRVLAFGGGDPVTNPATAGLDLDDDEQTEIRKAYGLNGQVRERTLGPWAFRRRDLFGRFGGPIVVQIVERPHPNEWGGEIVTRDFARRRFEIMQQLLAASPVDRRPYFEDIMYFPGDGFAPLNPGTLGKTLRTISLRRFIATELPKRGVSNPRAFHWDELFEEHRALFPAGAFTAQIEAERERYRETEKRWRTWRRQIANAQADAELVRQAEELIRAQLDAVRRGEISLSDVRIALTEGGPEVQGSEAVSLLTQLQGQSTPRPPGGFDRTADAATGPLAALTREQKIAAVVGLGAAAAIVLL